MKPDSSDIGTLFSQYSNLNPSTEIKNKLLAVKRLQDKKSKIKKIERELKESQKDLQEANKCSETATNSLKSKMDQMKEILRKIKAKLVETEDNSNAVSISEQAIELYFTCQICSHIPFGDNSMRIICKNGHSCCKKCRTKMKNGCHLCRKQLLDIEDRNINSLIQEVKKNTQNQGLTLKDAPIVNAINEEINAINEDLSEKLGVNLKNSNKFLLSTTQNKVYSVCLSNFKIEKLRFILVNGNVVGFSNYEICLFTSNKTKKVFLHFEGDEFNISEFNQNNLREKTIVWENKIYFLNSLRQIIVLFRDKSKKIVINKMLFIFDRLIRNICFKGEEMYVSSEDKFIYHFSNFVHDNQVCVEEEIFGLNAAFEEYLLVLKGKSLDFYEKKCLNKAKTFAFEGEIKEKSKIEVVEGNVIFILEGNLVFLSAEENKITRKVAEISTFGVEGNCILAVCAGDLVSLNGKGEEISRIKLGELKVSQIFSNA